ncbi:MAG: hypothetical protein K9H16_07175 [Bacteroidales bacterium]|nr:hypothetical protein [Bacteroidales bacterium]
MDKIFTRKYLRTIILRSLVFIPLLLSPMLSAQFYNGYQMDFGRSRVQFDDFLWTYYRFDRFDTYFYLNGKELAVHTAKYAQAELSRYEADLDTYLEGHVQFIIFNNLNDLKQSNIGLTSETEYNIGGISYILGNKIILYFDGSMVNFERQIRQGIAHVLLQNAIFGSNIGSQVMNSFLQNFPEWYSLGLIAYLAEDWNTDIDNRIRNVLQSGKYKKFNRMVMDETLVKDAGHSFWRFVAQKYGKTNIVSIINMTRVSRSIETGFMYVLGLNLDMLYKEWLNFYTTESEASLNNRISPPDDKILTGKKVLKRNSRDRTYSELQVSPDGKYAAFVTNETGKYKVWLKEMNSEKLKKIYTGGYKLDEKIDYSYPILTWHPSGRFLTMVLEKKGLIWLYFYNVDDRNLTSQNIFGFDKILDISYTNDGRSLLFSGVQKGQNDIFLFTISSGSYEQITNDVFDDLNPRFLENQNKIIFSSNRSGDTLQWNEQVEPGKLPQYYDLFLYDYGTKDPLLRRLTNTPVASEKQPQPYIDGYFSFLSDENGIYNEHIGMPDSAVSYVDTAVHYRYFTRSFAVSNYQKNISELHISPTTGYKTWIINDKLYDKLYIDDFVLSEMLEPEELINTNYMNQLQTKLQVTQNVVEQTGVSKVQEEELEISGQSGQRKSFRNLKRENRSGSGGIVTRTENSEAIDISNYHIGKPADGEGKASASQADKSEDDFILPKQRIYYTQYSINQLVTQIDFSYLNQTYQPYSVSANPGTNGNIPGFDLKPNYTSPGLSPTFTVGITDLMENYRIMGGVRIGLDLVNKEYFFNYANLKNRLDKEFVFQRRSLEEPIVSAYVTRQKINEGFYVLTYPLNRVIRVKGTILFRNENYAFAGPDEFAIRYPNVVLNWGGAKLQLVYDDTKELGLNLYEGSRFMVFGEYNQLIDQLDRNLIVLGFDFRNYIRLHRQFIWANRIAGSTNFGTERLLYYMGGTDSWMIPSFDQETRIDPDQNWIYQALATNMRGFNQNARNGNSFVVINSELRLPIFRYLLNKPIKSEFVKNFQVVAFGDIGTAWSGWNPYDEDNVLYTRYEESGPLRIKVQYEKDPLIGGIGFGARTKLLGYFIKGDLAWGIEDGRIKKNPLFYLSMSLDF